MDKAKLKKRIRSIARRYLLSMVMKKYIEIIFWFIQFCFCIQNAWKYLGFTVAQFSPDLNRTQK